jgi:hypothetical protein
MAATRTTPTFTTFQPSTQNIVTFTATVGDTLRINRPVGYPPFICDKNTGNWPSYATSLPKTAYSALGFTVVNQTLGKFVDFANLTYDDGYIYYLQEKSGKQIIEYLSDGIQVAKFYVVIAAMQVHDHASVYMGGPAFATYYADVDHPEEM